MQLPPHLIHFKKNPKMPHIIDVELRDLSYCRRFDSVEVHLVVFPYSRRILTNDIQLLPYQDYVEDILQHQRSTYNLIPKTANKQFGLFLTLVVALIMFVFHPEDFSSAESLVSMFGAYVVGKEWWTDMERHLIQGTRNRRLRYTDPYYSYQIEQASTLLRYSSFAMQKRYGEAGLFPFRMEYMEQSSSKTVRLHLLREDFEVVGDTAHLLSIRLKSPELTEEFEKQGYMLGVKLSFNMRTWWGGMENREFFQSWSRGKRGCLDAKSEWLSEATFVRHTYTRNRWKYFKSQQIQNDCPLFDFVTDSAEPADALSQ